MDQGAPDGSDELVTRLRVICLELPETIEEAAWVGTRWRIRTRTFAHVLTIDAGWPPAYARAAGHDGPVSVLTFRAHGPELAAFRETGRPFFAPAWRGDEVGMLLEEASDWDDIRELVTESYRIQAPKKLAGLVP